MQYWKEVLRSCGKGRPLSQCLGDASHRIAFVERVPREKIRISKFLSPTAPVTMWPEIFKSRYQLSSPIEILIGIPAMAVGYYALDRKIMTSVDEKTQNNIPGARYAVALASEDLLSTDTFSEYALGRDSTMALVHLLKQHEDALGRWSASGKPEDLPRMLELLDLGLLPNRESFLEFNKIALRAYQQTQREKNPDDFAERLQNNLEVSLLKDPQFSKLDEQHLALLNLVFTPRVNIEGHPDLELIARSFGLRQQGDPLISLQEIKPGVSMTDYFRMAIDVIDHPDVLKQKQEAWKLVSDDKKESELAFLKRPDLPEFNRMKKESFDQKGNGSDLYPLKDELSYWKLVWKDPRFSDLKTSYQKSEISQLDVLNITLVRIKAYNEIYASGQKAGIPTLNTLCGWVGLDSASTSNILIDEPSKDFLDKIPYSRHLSASQKEACQLEIAEFFYHSYLSEVKSGYSNGLQSPQQLLSRLEQVLAHCPSQPVRTCKK